VTINIAPSSLTTASVGASSLATVFGAGLKRAGLVVALPILAASLLVAPVRAQVEVLDQVVAIVDDDVILATELQERIAMVKRSLEGRTDVPSDEIIFRETLDQLILKSIQLQLANRYGVRIPDAQLDEAMNRMANQNGMTLEQFREAVVASGQSYLFMREELRSDMMVQRVQAGNVNRNIQISEQEIDNFLATEEGEAMTQPEFHLVQALLEVSKNDSKAKVAEKEAFVDGVLASILDGTPFNEAVSVIEPFAFGGGDLGWRKVGEIPSMLADVVPSLKVGETAKVQSGAGFHLVYLEDERGRTRMVQQTEVRHILIKPTEVLDVDAAQEKAASIRQRIVDGEDFAELAKEYSDDIGSAAEGGDLGWTNPGQMVPEFEATVAATDIGEVSEPFQSQFGWHVLEVLDRREEDFADRIRRNQVANYLHDQKYEEELDAWLRKIREEAFVDIK